jgi:dipeptide/tripeptide permease
MVGHLYNGPTDPRRDGGFTVFCMGINHGAFASPLVCGTVGQKVNLPGLRAGGFRSSLRGSAVRGASGCVDGCPAGPRGGGGCL